MEPAVDPSDDPGWHENPSDTMASIADPDELERDDI